MEEREEASDVLEPLADGCPCHGPPIDRAKVLGHLCGLGGRALNHLRLVNNDAPPLEARQWRREDRVLTGTAGAAGRRARLKVHLAPQHVERRQHDVCLRQVCRRDDHAYVRAHAICTS